MDSERLSVGQLNGLLPIDCNVYSEVPFDSPRCEGGGYAGQWNLTSLTTRCSPTADGEHNTVGLPMSIHKLAHVLLCMYIWII